MKQEDVQLYHFHPKVLEAYKKHNHLDNYLPRAEEENEKNFWLQVNDAKKDVKRVITKFIRIKIGRKEHFFYHEQVKSFNIVNTPIHFYHRVGMVEIPQFIQTYNEKTRQLQSTDIEGYDKVYELNWPNDLSDDIQNRISDECDLVLINKGRHYGGYEQDQFFELSFDDLLTLGKYGTLNPDHIEKEKKKQRNAKQT